MENIIYRLADGRMWDVAKVCFIDAEEAAACVGAKVIDLVSAEGVSDETYLAKTLAFYGYPMGELALLSRKGIHEELARLDAEYLTPRTLAGLGTGDAEALARWNEHEERAIPLRERLAELE